MEKQKQNRTAKHKTIIIIKHGKNKKKLGLPKIKQ